MTMKKAPFGVTIATVAFGFCCLISEASATEVVTYAGTVTADSEFNFATGESAINVFLGDTFTAVFVQNPSMGGYYNNDGTTINSYGGFRLLGASPVEVSTFNVPGLSISMSGPHAYEGSVYAQNASVNGVATQGSSLAYSTVIINEIGAQGYGPNVPFTKGTGNAAGGSADVDYFGGGHVYEIQGSVTTVSISSVPEISTWAMMLAGFAAVGFAGYRRNRAATAAA